MQIMSIFEAQFAAELPEASDKGRRLDGVHVEDVMVWERFVAARTMSPTGSHLGDLNWRQLVAFIICKALAKTGYTAGSYYVTEELWQHIAWSWGLMMPEHVGAYLVEWGKSDRFVSELLTGVRPPQRSAADLGGWLADYMNTVLLVAMGRARADTKYKVVDNAWYQSLSMMTFAAYDDFRCASQSAVFLGNIWETLAWHAYERDRPEFLFGLLFMTTTCPISYAAPAAPSARAEAAPPPPRAETPLSALPVPPPPATAQPSGMPVPPPPPPRVAPPPPPPCRPQHRETQKHTEGAYNWLELVCRESTCQATAVTPQFTDTKVLYEYARELGWGTPSTKGWSHSRCPRCKWT